MRILILTSLFAMLVACSEDGANNLSVDGLQGKWLIEAAKRNKKPTKLLKDGFIEFRNDSLVSNINVQSDTLINQFRLKNKVITAGKFNYSVVRNNQDTLVLDTKISNFSFELMLVKE